jgi:hypothetical protein
MLIRVDNVVCACNFLECMWISIKRIIYGIFSKHVTNYYDVKMECSFAVVNANQCQDLR